MTPNLSPVHALSTVHPDPADLPTASQPCPEDSNELGSTTLMYWLTFHQVVEQWAMLAHHLAHQKRRMQALQHHVQPVIRDAPLIGHSKAAIKLRSQVEHAAGDRQPIIFQAAAGTGKTFLAGWIHQRSSESSYPFVELDCTQLPQDESGQPSTDALFGHSGGQAGLLEVLERGTLLIDQVHGLPRSERDRLWHYLRTNTFHRNPDPATGATDDAPLESWARLMLASPYPLPLEGVDGHMIKLFTLPQRKGDIPVLAQYFVEQYCREQERPLLHLDQADVRRLISYDYPGNLGELASILHRAVTMTPPGQATIPEQVLWSVQSDKNAFRVDLLNQFPWLRQVFLSRWYPQGVWGMMVVVFVPATVLGFLGPPQRDASMTLNLFWAWWWPFYLFLFAFVGRLWCAVCPFMITAEWLRSLSLWLFPRQQKPWNTRWLNRWGAWILFAGFLAIYLWETLWDLPHTPYLSSWLLVVITAGAVVFSLIYERRLWCRYLCPIGGMNGLFAKLSITELRSTQQICGSQCSTFGCYKGSPATPVNFAHPLPTEGQASTGCPLYSHPAQLRDNRDCILCMACLKTCPNRSAQFNLRFPATDLLESHDGFWAEAALLLLLLGGVLMHHSHTLLTWVGSSSVAVDSAHLATSLPLVLGLLSLPAGLIYATHAIARWCDSEMPDYLAITYAYLPLTLAANLAHYIPAGVMEAGQLLPVTARTLGLSGAGWPTLTWSLDVAQFLQGVTLLSALAFSIYPLFRITHRPLLSNLPHLLLISGLIAFFFQLMIYSN